MSSSVLTPSTPFILIENKLVRVHLDAIEFNPVQPAERTGDREIAVLFNTISYSHFVAPIEVQEIPGKFIWRENQQWQCYRLVNGHRRVDCAQRLGVTVLSALVLPDSVSTVAGWVERNTGPRSVTSNEYFTAWGQCRNSAERAEFLMALRRGRRKLANMIDSLVALTGLSKARALAARGTVSPLTYVTASKLASRISKESVPNAASLLQVFEWIVGHNAKRMIDDVLRNTKLDPQVMGEVNKLILSNSPAAWAYVKKTGRRALVDARMPTI